jgi:hypothetical protein
VQLELINTPYQAERLYASPLHAVWKVTSGESLFFIDAKTGEALPLQSKTDQQELDHYKVPENMLTLPEPEHTITASLQLPEFDPYDKLPWVKGSPFQYESAASLTRDLDQQKQLTYTAQLYTDKVTVPLAVTGYDQWSNEEVFLLLEQNGQRAIPYNTASRFGTLYP